MKKSTIFLLLSLYVTCVFAQYSVSNTSITFYDSERDRNIECGIHYPSIIDTEPGETEFPYIIFGHGFSMGINPYSFLADGLVPHGVIIILPSTETGLSPSHESFAKDMAFLANHFYQQSLEAEGHFHNSVRNDYFIMGHSMGGGCAHLASSYEVDPLAIITFAAAETNPSAMEAASEFSGKTIMFYGQNDNVTPYAEHQEPIYYNSASNCKTVIQINGGIHCYFNNYDFTCWMGEFAVGSNAQISRAEQQQVVIDFMTMLIYSEMYQDQESHENFIDSLILSPRIEYLRYCGEGNPFLNVIDYYDEVQNITLSVGTPEEIAISELVQEISISDTEENIHIVGLNWQITDYQADISGIYNAAGSFELPANVYQTSPNTDLSIFADIVLIDPVQILNHKTPEFKLYPNPAKNIFYIDYINMTDHFTVKIFDNNARLVKSEFINNLGNGTIMIDTQKLSPGKYFITVKEVGFQEIIIINQ